LKTSPFLTDLGAFTRALIFAIFPP